MLKYTFKRLGRTPLPALGVLLLAAVLSAVLCGLHAFNEEAQRTYEETWHTIPVTLTVTNLSGTQMDNLGAPYWVADAIDSSSSTLTKYMKDPLIKSSHEIHNPEIGLSYLIGFTSSRADRRLWAENGGEITWLEGFDESIFSGEDALCIVPEGFTGDWDEETPGQQVYLYFTGYGEDGNGEIQLLEYELYLTAAGTFTGGGSDTLYCPYEVVKKVYQKMQEELLLDSVSATLVNNDLLDELNAEVNAWFAHPNPVGEDARWGRFGYDHYPYALDINDDLLLKATATLENSIIINRVCTVFIFILSAAAGFFIGFLMIRQRKREIALMRTMGTPNRAVYLSFAFEQMLCAVLGILAGGTVFLWQPVGRLAAFIAIYFVGLTMALVLFLRKNLLTTIKEDE